MERLRDLRVEAPALLVLIIMTVVTLAVATSSIDPMVNLRNTSNETWNASSNLVAPNLYTKLSQSNISSGTELVYNHTKSFVRGTDYRMNYTDGSITDIATGSISTTDGTPDYYLTYKWQAQNYVTNAAARVLISNVPLFVVLMLIFGLLYLIYDVAIKR